MFLCGTNYLCTKIYYYYSYSFCVFFSVSSIISRFVFFDCFGTASFLTSRDKKKQQKREKVKRITIFFAVDVFNLKTS